MLNLHRNRSTVSSYQLYFSPILKKTETNEHQFSRSSITGPSQSMTYAVDQDNGVCAYKINFVKAYLKIEVTNVFIGFTIDQSIKLSSSWASYSE